MKVENVAMDSLTLDPSNARKHPEKNLEAIKGSLKRFGQQKPIVVSADGVVVAGNGTYEAAKVLGWKKIAVHRSKLSGADLTAYALADNRTTEMSEWDDEALGKLLQGLYEDEYPIADIGFDPGDFDFGDSQPKDITGAKELSPDEFSDFDHKCPKCGFEFDDRDTSKNGTVEEI